MNNSKIIDHNNLENDMIIPHKGLHCMHLFYKIDYHNWNMYDIYEQEKYADNFVKLTHLISTQKDTQIITYAVVSPKADLGVMVITPNLKDLLSFEKRLNLVLGAEILFPVYHYFSLTEISEYGGTEEEYSESLIKERKLEKGSSEYEDALKEYRSRIKKYKHERVYPNLPSHKDHPLWQVFCFYNMSKKREGDDNWYMLDYEKRRKMMVEHGKIGRKWTGKVKQVITGSTGLDDAEWGVSLFAHNTQDIKEIVYQMRFDEVSAKYGVFGEFYIGIVMSPIDTLAQIMLINV